MKGYDKLTSKQKELFKEAYKVHLSGMDEEGEEILAKENIIEIKWDDQEDHLEVLFNWNDQFIKVGYTNAYWGHYYYIE
jgi:hypothetical protein